MVFIDAFDKAGKVPPVLVDGEGTFLQSLSQAGDGSDSVGPKQEDERSETRPPSLRKTKHRPGQGERHFHVSFDAKVKGQRDSLF